MTKPEYGYPLGRSSEWRKIYDSSPTDMYKHYQWFDWWIYQGRKNPALFLIAIQPGAAGDKQETLNFLRDLTKRLISMGGRIVSTGGGKTGMFEGDYLNDPACITVEFHNHPDYIRQEIKKINRFFTEGLYMQSNDMAETLKKLLPP